MPGSRTPVRDSRPETCSEKPLEADLQGQLAAIVEDLEAAKRRLDALVAAVPEEKWAQRADPARWSVAECIAHLNLTSQAYIPILREALDKCQAIPGPPPTRYRLDFAGWMIWRAVGPVHGFGRMRTPAPFVPQGDLSPPAIVAEFTRLQKELIKCVAAADGLALGKTRVVSPFNRRFRYNVFSALSILPRHQHRHLQQAEQVWAAA